MIWSLVGILLTILSIAMAILIALELGVVLVAAIYSIIGREPRAPEPRERPHDEG
jgi:hypothetical protein